MNEQYLLIKTHGRWRHTAVCHLVGPDGTHPLCGVRLNQAHWSLRRARDLAGSSRSLCQQCAAQAAREVQVQQDEEVTDVDT